MKTELISSLFPDINDFISFIPLLALLVLLFSLLTYLRIRFNSRRLNPSPLMREISSIISSSSMAFIKKEFILIFLGLFFIASIIWSFLSLLHALSFILGSFISLYCGLISVKASNKGDLCSAQASQHSNQVATFAFSFRAASVLGLSVVSLGILGIYFNLSYLTQINLEPLASFAFGASFVALFARIGGGIYIQAADLASESISNASLEEARHYPKDHRHPAMIVHRVGDSVGDVLGKGADLFESLIGAVIAAMIIGSSLPLHSQSASILPLLVITIGMFCSLLGILLIEILKSKNITIALKMAPLMAQFLLLLISYFLVQFLDFNNIFIHPLAPFFSLVIGTLVGVGIALSGEYYTSQNFAPVKRIAYSAKAGTNPHLLTGMAMGMYSVIAPAIIICTGVFLSHYVAGLYGIALSAVGMLATIGLTLSIEAQRPILDSATGINILSHSQKNSSAEQVTKKLSELSSSVSLVGKGLNIGGATFSALALFSAFATITQLDGISLVNPVVVIGLFIGAALPFFVVATSINAVGHAAQKIIHEVKRVFKHETKSKDENPFLNIQKCVQIATSASLTQMFKPAIVAFVTPLLIAHFFGKESLAALLAGVTVCGVLLALFLSNTARSWHNAKLAIQEGRIVGEDVSQSSYQISKQSDGLGEPLKGVSAPALMILVKYTAIIGLVISPVIN